MRGGNDVGSRMRVAAAACLVSSALFVGGAFGAVAIAEPADGGDATSTGSPGRAADGRAVAPRRTEPRSAGTAPRARSGAAGPRSAAPPARTSAPPDPGLPDPAAGADDSDEPDPSKLDGPEAGGDDVGSGDGNGGVDSDDEDVDSDVDDDDDDEECGWGWWPLPPDVMTSAPNGGDGYGGGAPSAAQPSQRLPVVPPATGSPPRELLPESPALPAAPDLMGPLPNLVLPPPVTPGRAGSVRGSEPVTPTPESPRPPAPARIAPAELPAAPHAGDGQTVASSYRAGYGEFLRTAGMSQVIAVAVPGATGMMLLTGAGGFIGYRQARAGLAVRSRGTARFPS